MSDRRRPQNRAPMPAGAMHAFVGGAGGARSISQSPTTLSEPVVVDSDEEENHQDVVQIAKDPWVLSTQPRPAYMGLVGAGEGEGKCQITVVKGKDKSTIEVWCYGAEKGKTPGLTQVLDYVDKTASGLWTGVCKLCHRAIKGTGVSRFLAHFQDRARGQSGNGGHGIGGNVCLKVRLLTAEQIAQVEAAADKLADRKKAGKDSAGIAVKARTNSLNQSKLLTMGQTDVLKWMTKSNVRPEQAAAVLDCDQWWLCLTVTSGEVHTSLQKRRHIRSASTRL